MKNAFSGCAGIGAPLEWGPSPNLEDPVTVAGYPLGGDNSSVTQVPRVLFDGSDMSV